MGNYRSYRKVFWDEIREHVKISNPSFFYLVDEISPKGDMPLYLFNFGYGDLIGDSKTFYIPHNNELMTLNNFSASDSITKDLFYGFHSSPLGFVLNKCFEWYLQGESENETYPVYIDKEGDFFNLSHVTKLKQIKQYLPNGILSVKAGAQSSFLIQNIGCKRGFNRLKKIKINCDPPKSYHSHSYLFKEIYNSCPDYNKWQASIIYFSEKWVDNIIKNPDWIKIKEYLFKYYLKYYAYASYGDYYQHIFRIAFDSSNLNRDFFIQDSAKYIFEIVIGEKYGFSFSHTDEFLPLSWIRNILEDTYKLATKPLIMVPKARSKEEISYFSLYHPIFRTYQGVSRKKVTLVSELESLYKVINKYTELFSSPHKEWSGTILEEEAKNISFSYYHGTGDKKSWTLDTSHLFESDPHLCQIDIDRLYKEAAFFKGCVSIK
jgi:hypothetical protein